MSGQQQIPQAAREALARGDMVSAIKAIRESSGGDLKSAMALAQRLVTEVQQAQQGQQGQQRGAHTGSHQVSETVGQRENRERTGEIMSKQHSPTVMPGDSGGRGLIWLLLIALAIGAWWLFGR